MPPTTDTTVDPAAVNIPIQYNGALSQNYTAKTLLKLIHDAVYDPVINNALLKSGAHDEWNKIINRYIPNCPQSLRTALIGLNQAADTWAEEYRNNGMDTPALRQKYSKFMVSVMNELLADLHKDAYSIGW